MSLFFPYSLPTVFSILTSSYLITPLYCYYLHFQHSAHHLRLTMALPLSTTSVFIFLVLASSTMELGASVSVSVKGSISCVDCSSTYDYSGISIIVKCDEMKKAAIMTTNRGGSFEAKLPLSTPSSSNCKARLFAAPKQLYALNKNMEAKVISFGDQANTYTTANTMTFASSCSSLATAGRCPSQLGSSKTIDLPIPPEYGLPPTSYYLAPLAPFLPIIGIP